MGFLGNSFETLPKVEVETLRSELGLKERFAVTGAAVPTALMFEPPPEAAAVRYSGDGSNPPLGGDEDDVTPPQLPPALPLPPPPAAPLSRVEFVGAAAV